MSFDRVRQVSPDEIRMLDLQPRATVRGTPAMLEASCRLRFRTEEDEFDAYQAATVRLDSSEAAMSDPAGWPGMAGFSDRAEPIQRPLTFMVQRYDHEPAGHLTIFLPSRLERGVSVESALARITEALGLPAALATGPAAA